MTRREVALQLTSQFIEINQNSLFDKLSDCVEKDIEEVTIQKTELINKIFNSFYENLTTLENNN